MSEKTKYHLKVEKLLGAAVCPKQMAEVAGAGVEPEMAADILRQDPAAFSGAV